MSTPERIQKLLARAGYGSRRQIEAWIEAGLVTVNGRVATLGDQATAEDKITLRERPVALNKLARFKARVLVYNKPIGEVCTRSDPEGRPTVFDRLPRMQSSRWVSVGRLDLNTLGLLLVTNDGELANRLTHPSSEIERVYMVRVLGEVDDEMLRRLEEGVELEDGPAHFDTVEAAGGTGANRWFRVTLGEGRKREVRRLWESQGVRVSRLMRVAYGPITLDRSLREGRWRELAPPELARLYRAVGLPVPHMADEAGGRGERRPKGPPKTRRKAGTREASGSTRRRKR